MVTGLLVSDGLPKGDTLRIAIAHSGKPLCRNTINVCIISQDGYRKIT